MADVFISYKAEDRRRIEPLVRALQADGYSVWWDQDIGAGDEWRKVIERELDAARCVVVAWSKRSVSPEGRFVRDEAARAQARGICVPITIDPVRIPLGFGESQVTSLRGWGGDQSDKRYQTVLTAITRVVGQGSNPVIRPTTLPRFERRNVLAGGIAAVATASLGGWVWWRRGSKNATDSVAVLPFENLSNDPAQAFFAEGIAGEIRSTLTRVAGLKVAGSTSSEAVRKQDAQTAASKLGVANILTGNVRRSASTIRVTAELIDGETGLTKWSQSYDRAPGDVITVQTDIAKNVVSALAVALSARVRQAIATGETTNIAAQTLVFQARNNSYQLTVPALQQSMQLLDQAIGLDPNYARAFAIKSFVANNLASRTSSSPEELAKGRVIAESYATRALSIAPNLPIARSALAFTYSLVLRVGDSIREHKIAVSLASGDPDVIRNFGFILTSTGQNAESFRYIDEARSLDPLNWASHYAHTLALFCARRFDEAVDYSLKLKRDSPDLFRFSELLGRALLMLGRTEEAAGAFGQQDLAGLALVAARSGNRPLALAKLAALHDGDEQIQSFFSSPTRFKIYVFARIHAQLGDAEAAFAALDRAWVTKDADLLDLKVDPFLDPLRTHPRFAPMVARLGFPA
jgi:serine/threonine-protein kinase